MIKFVNAKINLGLNVIRRRPDGYHDLSTVFYPVGKNSGINGDAGSLADVIEIVPSEKDTLTVFGQELNCPITDNLVWKALLLFRSIYPDLQPVNIFMEKNIPSQAGMGGGSADAAFTLMMLNELCGCPFDESQMKQAALRLGADCPFFMINNPCIASGVGEILTPVALNLSGYNLVVLKPDEGISTAQAFKYVTLEEQCVDIELLLNSPIKQWKDFLNNDFEKSAFKIFPDMQRIKEYLYEQGAEYASMSGSGSAFYGLFKDYETAYQAYLNAKTPFRAFEQL
ncbi:MAG: 4-(cytidine 5'-diphospho)-2-C-methyl-D-erythritol kinase [Prevotella sp.]|nr:4-(cytidine 5'-diphospho)-2-C-methyl-D-erythritol kinase [Prevotella sp.]MCM1074708.1 4-(cytidine 5'-diphospho)-2-C-methyl-D-erythritol kinase [Ruminococcus sp.]